MSVLRDFLLWCLELVWERRLRHARTVRLGIEREMRREVLRAQSDLEYCETMASRARMARVQSRADRTLLRRGT